ncbi:hypothetical protein DT070_00010 [Polaromonas sp. SP1]|nr:hypothetical protein DT070_00010 [Polaromonas sp. SP1]QGJ18591.1 hypothetical protein F7R28_09425 [Polaromonas sp. Pch-P]
MTGIPYTMTKPEYTVDVTPDSEDPSKEVYTLHKIDVPDPNQRYTIALDPALFTDGKFTLKLGDNGNLTDANAVMSSRVVATIKAVGTLALNSAKGAYDETETLALERYRGFLDSSTQPACTARVKPGGKASAKIDRAIMALVEKGEKEKQGSGIDAATSGYFYTSLGERDCLTAVRATIEGTKPDYVGVSQTAYDNASAALNWLDTAPPTEKTTTLRNIVKAVRGWVQAKDVASISKATTYTGKNYRDVAGLDKFMTSARNHVNELLAADRVKSLAKAFDIKPAVWRARVVKSIDRDIDALRLAKDLAPTRQSQITSQIAIHERRRADLVGGIALYDRIKKIDEFLKEVKTVRATSDGGVRYAADEHIKLREERDKLAAQLQGLVASTVSSDTKGGDKAKVKPRTSQQVRLANQEFVDKVNSNLGVLFDEPPEFVLVLTRKEGGNFTDAPILKSAKEGQK